MANLTGLGLVPQPFRTTKGIVMGLSDDRPLVTHKRYSEILVEEGTIRHAANVTRILHATLVAPKHSHIHIQLHELAEAMSDEDLEQVIGRGHGMADAFAGTFFWNVFSSLESLELYSTWSGRNAIRLSDTAEWLIWFWQPDRHSWYIQLTRGKSKWQPGDRIATQVATTAEDKKAA